MTISTTSLTRAEAQERAALITVEQMTVDLDLDQGTDQFGSRTRIEFACATPGEATFLDLRAVEVHRIELNGIPIEVGSVTAGRVDLRDLQARNVIEVDAAMAYSRDGQGLHRSTDPADGNDYIYGHLFLDAAPTVFACFDQPDLKAPYAVTVKAPLGWIVIGNGRATRISEGRWQLSETLPLATYFVTICAGPYVSVRAEHDGIPLGLHARASLQTELERHAPQMLEITRASFDYFHQRFGIRYPFGDYDQVFVPEFNAGAMENPGCVTFRDQLLFRGAASRTEVLTRSNTIAHEMAHMWFGDLVTMRWWDDLWLNESFAEYMAYAATSAATEFTDSWVEFGITRKQWGYAADRAPSTHPVAGSPAPDAASALSNFDGISYAKGASVLRALVSLVGVEAFDQGVANYLVAQSYRNGELTEFMAAIEAASGRDLGEWARQWLRTAGVDTIAYDRSGVLTRVAPEKHPAQRPHAFELAGFTGGKEVFRQAVELDADQLPVSLPTASVIVPNASDQTWAIIDLDPATRAALPSELALIGDPLVRAVVWGALISGVYRGGIDPSDALDVLVAAWPAETDSSLQSRVAEAFLVRIVPTFFAPAQGRQALVRIAEIASGALQTAGSGSDEELTAARVLARSSGDRELLARWLAGSGVPARLADDSDFRWQVVAALARLGAGEDVIADELVRDQSLQGKLAALTARAARPDSDSKQRAWAELTGNRELSNYELNAIASGFWSSGSPEVLEPYAAAYVRDIPAMSEWVRADAMDRVAALAFPSRVVEADTVQLVRAAIDSGALTSGVRRAMIDELAKLEEALASRSRHAERAL